MVIPAHTYRFHGIIKPTPGMNAGFIEIPEEIARLMGGKGRYKVKALISGVEYRGSIQRMEKGGPLMLIATQEVRRKAGVSPGEIVEVILREDREPRIVELPRELSDLFGSHPDTEKFFRTLSYTQQKEYARMVDSAVKTETRQLRAAKVLGLMHSKMHSS